MLVPEEALVLIPDSLGDIDAAPLLCAGITTYNALTRSQWLPRGQSKGDIDSGRTEICRRVEAGCASCASASDWVAADGVLQLG